ncbi:hypothetical protein B0H14DRAFT_2635762 [Mycena olivaceomarginata]|nr:hypothetical protein B0H14DRAFT_2635762 [Mycena olivaceomarginata]
MLANQPDYFRDDVDLDLVGMVAIGGRDVPRPCGSLPEEREGEGGSAWESRQSGCGWVDIEWTRGGPGTGGYTGGSAFAFLLALLLLLAGDGRRSGTRWLWRGKRMSNAPKAY